MTKPKIYTMPFAKIYPLYIAKAERKGRTKEEVDDIITWMTGYDAHALNEQLTNGTDMETFFRRAPHMNDARHHITGVICGVRVEEMEQGTMQEIRYLDKCIDELAKGKTMEKILREGR